MTAELIIVNGEVLTMDATRPRAEAVAMSNGKITRVGRTRDMLAYKGRKTRIVDAAGRTVLPGFIDGHVHITSGSMELSMLNVHGLVGLDEISAAVKAFALANPGNGIIIGNALSYVAFGEGRSATRHDLDKCLPDRPLVLYAPDHHTAWANTRALEQGGILRGKTLPAGHEIVLGEDGLATGELRAQLVIRTTVTSATDYMRQRPSSKQILQSWRTDSAISRGMASHLSTTWMAPSTRCSSCTRWRSVANSRPGPACRFTSSLLWRCLRWSGLA